jgi:ribosomal protein S14
MNLETKNIVKILLLTLLKKRSILQKKKQKKDFRQFYAISKHVWKDHKKRTKVNKYEIPKKYLDTIKKNLILPTMLRKVGFKICSHSKLNLKVHVKNRCILCGQSHSVYKKWRLSRICLREQIRFGNLNGIQKL